MDKAVFGHLSVSKLFPSLLLLLNSMGATPDAQSAKQVSAA